MADRLARLQGIAGRRGARSAYGLLALDLIAVGWVISESFLPEGPLVFAVDIAMGVVLAAEMAVRLRQSRAARQELLHPAGLADLIACLLITSLDVSYAVCRSRWSPNH